MPNLTSKPVRSYLALALVMVAASIATVGSAAAQTQSRAPSQSERAAAAQARRNPASTDLGRPASAQEPRKIDLPYKQWLREPNHADIPWHIRVLPARLTLGQRQLLRILVTVSARKLQKRSARRDLHFLVKAADAQENWYDDESYGHFVVEKEITSSDEIEFSGDLLVRPGRYLLALMMFDTVLGERNVARRWVTVPEVKHDPLPGIDRRLPPVGFLPMEMGVLAAEDDRLSLPVHTTRPVQVDIVVNFSPSAVYTGHTRVYRRNLAAFLQIANVLSQLEPERGCVRLSGIDVLGLRVLFERLDAAHLDWEKIYDAVGAVNPSVVDVDTLQGQKQTAAFFRDFMQKLVAEQDGVCGPADVEQTRHVYVIAGSGMQFPQGTRVEPMHPVECDCRGYYLRGEFEYAAFWDQMERIVKPLPTRRINIQSPQEFRAALASIVADLQTPAR